MSPKQVNGGTDNSGIDRARRRFLVGLGAASAVALAGCAGSRPAETAPSTAPQGGSAATPTAQTPQGGFVPTSPAQTPQGFAPTTPSNSPQSGSAPSSLVASLTSPVGTWVHHDALPPQQYVGGAPAARTIVVWNFNLNEISQRSGFHGEGHRQTVTESPNGFIPVHSGTTGNLGGHYQWHLSDEGGDTGTLRLVYQGLGTVPGRQPYAETFRLAYRRESDTFEIQPLDDGWQGGTWVRLTDPARGFDQPTAASEGREGRYTEYRTVGDDGGVVQFEAPIEWSNVSIQPIEGGAGPVVVTAAPPQTAGAVTPGVSVAVLTDPALLQRPDAVLQARTSAWRHAGCTDVWQEPFSNSAGLTGTSVLFAACGGLASVSARVVLAAPPAGTSLVLVELLLASDRDNEAAERILGSLRVNA